MFKIIIKDSSAMCGISPKLKMKKQLRHYFYFLYC